MGRANDAPQPLWVRMPPGDVVALRDWSDGRTARVRRVEGKPYVELYLRYRSGYLKYFGYFATPFEALEFADNFVWMSESAGEQI